MRYIVFLIIVFSSIKLFGQPGFIENKGQWNSNALFKTDIPNGALYLEKDGLTYNFIKGEDIKHSHAHHGEKNNLDNNRLVHLHCYKVKFGNTSLEKIQPVDVYSDYTNYFIGNDPKKWVSKALKYNAVHYKNLYDNIDFQIYFNKSQNLQYDFLVKPGGNTDDIRLTYEGQDDLYVDTDGSLIVKTSINKVTELKPFAYQEINGEQVKIPCKFLIRNGNVAFQFATDYNHNEPLIIDPTLVFSTYTGATTDNWGFTATFDDQSNVFSGGISFSTGGYPVSVGAYQVNYAGGEYAGGNYYGCDISIIKYDSTGTQRLWATYLGGSISEELPHSLVCDRNNNLIIMGTTGSTDFPTTTNCYDNTFNGGTTVSYDNVIYFNQGTDIFVSKLSSNGSQLLASTFIGGSQNDGLNFKQSYNSFMMQGNDSLYYNYADGARGEVIVDKAGDVYVGTCTFSSNFPVTAGAFQPVYSGKEDGVVFKFDQNLTNLQFSSYFGGSNDDAIYSLDLDYNGDIYIGGGTNSQNILTTGGVYQPLSQGGTADGFFAHISSNGTTLIKSSYFGSSLYDQVFFIRVDKSLNVYLTGQTKAPGSTFIFNAAYGTPNSGQFITKFPNNLSTPIWSTSFGTGIGKPNISITAFSVDYCNRVYLAGWGREWANYGDTVWYVDGTHNMDVTANAFQNVTDGQDFYLMVMADDASHLEYATFFGELHQSGSSEYCGHDHVDGGTSRFDKRGYIYESVCASCGNYSNGYSCNGFPTYPNPGAWSVNNGGYNNTQWNCNNAVFKFSFDLPLTIADFQAPSVCLNTPVQFTNNSLLATDYLWDFGDGNTSTAFEPTHTYTNPGTYIVTLIASHPTSCNLADSLSLNIIVEQLSVSTNDTSLCVANSLNIGVYVNGSTNGITYYWSSNSNFTDTLNSNHNDNMLNVNPIQSTTYYVHVFSPHCDVIDSVKVTLNSLNITTSPDTTLCPGNNATIHVYYNVAGDTLSYLWSPLSSIISGQNTSSPQVLPTQNTWYHVTVSNQFGCSSKDSILVVIDQFAIDTGNIQNISCFNLCNGSISVNVINGYYPYSYLWNIGDTTASISNLCVNNYSVTVTDNVGCSYSLPFSISQPPLLTATISSLSNASCDPVNPNTGSAVVTPSGGTPNYTYTWNNSLHDSLITNLYAGTYQVTVYDANNCNTVLNITIDDPSNLAIATTSQNTQCYGSCDGNAQVAVTTQGIPPYNYLWNNGYDSTQINNLCSGYYTITVTDSIFCARVNYVYVNQPDSINSKITSTGINCNGGTASATGSVIHGGTAPFTYSWSTSASGATVTDLTPGTYWLYVTDAHNCPDSTYIVITEPEVLMFNSNLSPSKCTRSCNGTSQVIPYGGTSPYSYFWSNGSTSSSIYNLCEGVYNVTMTDNKGCSVTETFNIISSDSYPQVDATTNNNTIFAGQNTQLYAVSNSSNLFTWAPVSTINGVHLQNPTASPTITTTYLVNVLDGYGCINTDTVTIYVIDVVCGEPYIYVPNAFTPNNDNNNDILYVKADIASKIYFAIYDRWGELVFSTTDVNKGWNGTFRGKAEDPAVFAYYLKVTCIDKMQFEKKGNITLIR